MLAFGPTKPETEFQLFTEHPVALESRDHIVPGGTMMDDTRGKTFVALCAKLFIEKYNRPYAFLDLGCSSGGLVEETLKLRESEHYRKHPITAVGLEGSDYSLARNRAAWARI